jgi:hypothetical protein
VWVEVKKSDCLKCIFENFPYRRRVAPKVSLAPIYPAVAEGGLAGLAEYHAKGRISVSCKITGPLKRDVPLVPGSCWTKYWRANEIDRRVMTNNMPSRKKLVADGPCEIFPCRVACPTLNLTGLKTKQERTTSMLTHRGRSALGDPEARFTAQPRISFIKRRLN